MAGVRGPSVFKLGSLRFSFSYNIMLPNQNAGKHTKGSRLPSDGGVAKISSIVYRKSLFNNETSS